MQAIMVKNQYQSEQKLTPKTDSRNETCTNENDDNVLFPERRQKPHKTH